ncbi:MAG TPA: trigger factor [bacterium]|nr:trigger factor [bacterium]
MGKDKTIVVKKETPCSRELSFSVAEQEILDHAEAGLLKIQSEVSLTGFRKGKAPAHLVKQLYFERARSEAVDTLMRKKLYDYIEDEKLSVVGVPRITEMKEGEGKDIRFSASFEFLPVIEPRGYKGIKLEKKPEEVKKEEIDHVLENLRQRAAVMKPVEREKIAKEDYAQVRYSLNVAGKVHQRGPEMVLLNEKSLLPGVWQNIEGMNKTEEKSFSVRIPQDFQQEELRNKDVKIKFKVENIYTRELPEISDKLAETLGNKSLEELKKIVAERIGAEKKEMVRLDLEEQIARALLEKNKIQIPSSLVEERVEERKKEQKNRKHQGKHQEEDDNKLKERAEKELTVGLLLKEIGVQENIAVSPEEIDDKAKELGFKQNQLTEDYRTAIHNSLLTKKIIDFILSGSKIKEKEE